MGELKQVEEAVAPHHVEEELDEAFIPHVSHDDYREITPRAIMLSILLSIVLGAANVYLGLLVGMTVSASIPASVMSMALLRCFKDSNILENNIVQTAASAGESLAAAVIFTIPALTILNKKQEAGEEGFEDVVGWDTFLGTNYLIVLVCASFGGITGIAYSTILRNALIVDPDRCIKPPLKFPEGVATAQVLKSGEEGGRSVLAVAAGGLLGAVTKLFESLGLYDPVAAFGWFYRGNMGQFYPSSLAVNVGAALFGVGYIVGPGIASTLAIGSVMHFLIAIPISAVVHDRYYEDAWNVTTQGPFTARNVAMTEFDETRYIGIGLMILGGIWSLITIRKALVNSVKLAYREFRKARTHTTATTSGGLKRYERDLPFNSLMIMILGSMIPLYIVFSIVSDEWGFNIIMSLVVSILSALFSSVAAYMAGLVGSSNNPISGTTIVSSLLISALILAFYGSSNPIGPMTAVIMCSAVASACAISGDNLQDLKCGRICGATPYKQELIMIVGVLSAAFVVAPILQLLDVAYGIGTELSAPQASIIATIPVGIINGTLPWSYIGIGLGLGVVVVLFDELVLARNNSTFRVPVLSLAISFYLPPEYLLSIFLGSLVHIVARTSAEDQASEGILYAAGLIAGESLFGIMLAIPIVVTGDGDVLKVISGVPPVWPCVFPFVVLFASMYYIGKYQPFTGTSHNKQQVLMETPSSNDTLQQS